MLLPELFEVTAAFEGVGIRYWLFGGNAVELVTGRDIRPHDDVGLFVALEHAERAVQALEELGFAHHAGSLERGDVFYSRDGVLVDLVPVDDSADPPRSTGVLQDLPLPSGFPRWSLATRRRRSLDPSPAGSRRVREEPAAPAAPGRRASAHRACPATP